MYEPNKSETAYCRRQLGSRFSFTAQKRRERRGEGERGEKGRESNRQREREREREREGLNIRTSE